jgi:hypothetical protein
LDGERLSRSSRRIEFAKYIIKQKSGQYFIDQDGFLFYYILSYLRSGSVNPQLMEKSESIPVCVSQIRDKYLLSQLLEASEFYGLPELSAYISKQLSLIQLEQDLGPFYRLLSILFACLHISILYSVKRWNMSVDYIKVYSRVDGLFQSMFWTSTVFWILNFSILSVAVYFATS